jgi:hypothetical protein
MVRLQPGLQGKLDDWRRSQAADISRPEAIRRLVESALDNPNLTRRDRP